MIEYHTVWNPFAPPKQDRSGSPGEVVAVELSMVSVNGKDPITLADPQSSKRMM